ncbi:MULTISPECIES: sulfite exporter TauE/SafE family protein [Metabacillus]|uniref:Sulfite exporter TauE/SafE family protein n=1 Tax=Metabacillus hrfriensis TaxID=3048891 RepID=A0ACD4R990_9BACI|nr:MULTISPECIES: sulfite exporter TauE/SafE family protein [Metabacillus]UAL51540.1 sulfite exporter TauE/SafE family protein [Metabacillus dongyingensis]USK27845.1 sulfite exporter TauE/SafE family protein [Bacillus sp. CMF21]WHZ57052.1 sulfite exporter TauE/SafE family protein [Metabacillus sp. CT-WN-B3]
MRKLIIFAFIGFLAQLIDGSLGMAYGVTSTTMLLTFGIAPAVASASVHLAEVVTTAASGASHIKFGNVDKQAVYKLIIPGSIGAFAGAAFLSNLPGDLAKPFIAIFLLVLGLYVMLRFLFHFEAREQSESLPLTRKKSIPLGLIAGFADATGGGGWGPIATPVLLSQKGSSARKVVGTVDTSEFAIAVSATLGFFIALGWEQVNWYWVFALMIGGIVAAPIAAWLVRKLPAYLLGVLVGGFIVLTNSRTLLTTWAVDVSVVSFIYGFILIGWALAVGYAVKRNRVKVEEEISIEKRRA